MLGLNFTENEDAARFISEKGIKIINLCHIPEDGKLKTLSFSAVDENRVREILEFGERVDGSSLFSFIEPSKSDIYVSPDPSKAFVNPFAATPSLNVICDYLDENGKPLSIAPKNVLLRAEERLCSSSGVTLRALAELEFYVICKLDTEALFPGAMDRNYHESSPFAEFENLRNDVLTTLASMGIATKYGHSEVGRIVENEGTHAEQHEVEFIPQSLGEMAETIAIGKWVVRNVCKRYGVAASFSPKIDLEHAGTGMHVHLCGLRNHENVIANSDGSLSADGLRMIGGILKLAPSLSAFGNTTPVSYLRFISQKESPIHICWSARNRLALIRVPLWWKFRKEDAKMNECRRTFEYRAPDAFADAFLLLASLAVGVDYGLKHPDEANKIAENLCIEAPSGETKDLEILPRSCCEAANNLRKDRRFYEAHDVFPRRLIDKTIEKLKTYNDTNLWKELSGKPSEAEKLMKQYIHYG